MAKISLLKPTELYNLLNRSQGSSSRLAEVNYLYLMDARETQDYNTSHIITAKEAKTDAEGTFLLSEWVEVGGMQHVVIYDNNTSSIQQQGRAVDCARVLSKASVCPVHILDGGFQRFSALYSFLRSEKILFTIMELENLRVYPVEILPGLLYMGDLNQGADDCVLNDLKINALINITETDSLKGRSLLNVFVEDSVESDLYTSLISSYFSGSHIELGSRVLIVSRRGRSRCSTASIAFLMRHLSYTLEEAWRHTLKCKPLMRPNTGFIHQLSEWEMHTKGEKLTDISEPFLFNAMKEMK
uniref:Serine/threonine/tyrosine-interacting-like protein 1 n=1 Tax=Gouania willdenowi TaxID=441366 RepID=A0A8C5E830_GOUWI